MQKKVRIYTVAGKPDFVSLQADSFRAFCHDRHKLIVVNNADTSDLATAVAAAARDSGLECIDSGEQDHSNANLAIAVPLNWLWREHVAPNKDDISVVIDFDMFLVGDFSFAAELGSHALAAVKQARQHVRYLWNGIVIADASKLAAPGDMSWLCGPVDGVNTDVGGHLYYWLRATHKQTMLKNIDFTGDIRSARDNLDVLPETIRTAYTDGFDFQIHARKILHYKRGSGWSKADTPAYHDQKSGLLHEFVNGAIAGRITLPDRTFEWRGWNSGILDDYTTRTFTNYWDRFDDPLPVP